MGQTRRIDDLELDQDLAFTQREWRFQRVGWIVIGLFLLGTLAGLFGTGPLSSARVEGQQADVRMEYPRLARVEAPAVLRMEVGPGVGQEGTVRLWLDLDYLENVEIRQVTPQPEQVEEGPDRLTFSFRIADAAMPATVTFHVRPERVGLLRGQFGLTDQEALTFTQWVYP
jgi:hypothetical protein